MRRKILLALPALQEVLAEDFRQIKYSLFPPLSLLTLAGLTPDDRYEILVCDEHVESVELDQPVDLVAMTVYVSSADRAYEMADLYRRRGAKVVLGGIHPTALPFEAARHADAVCLGPAEPIWPELLSDFERGALRPFYRGRCAGSAGIVPAARRDLMNPRAYLVPQTMVTSRGCPHACDFCYKSGFWGERYYEGRPLADIERELDGFDQHFVFFLDDNFLGNRRRARDVFALLRGSGLVWQAGASLDVARDPAFLDAAYDAGCRSLFVGFESLAPENMRQANKRVNVATDYRQAVRRLHDAGIMINGSFVFGFDCDGPDVFGRTVAFAVENEIETATFHVLTPFPGTPFFDRMARDGRLLHRDWRRYDTRHAVFRLSRMTADELETGYRAAYQDFYTYGSILRRSVGLPGVLKRIAYNVGWKKMDRLWAFVIRHGLLPSVRPAFEFALARSTRRRRPEAPGPDRRSAAPPIGWEVASSESTRGAGPRRPE
jgi:radical SAM superfamily enzyme YgiQ (UPF0313 family)